MSDDDTTPPYQEQPEHLPHREVKRIERMLGRKPNVTAAALAERYRTEGADQVVMLAQVALDVHDMKGPIGLLKKLAIGVASSSVAILLFVAYVVSNRTERDVSLEYRMQRCERMLTRFEFSNGPPAGFPVASGPPSSKGPPP